VQRLAEPAKNAIGQSKTLLSQANSGVGAGDQAGLIQVNQGVGVEAVSTG
jgi:hypothetical protein